MLSGHFSSREDLKIGHLFFSKIEHLTVRRLSPEVTGHHRGLSGPPPISWQNTVKIPLLIKDKLTLLLPLGLRRSSGNGGSPAPSQAGPSQGPMCCDVPGRGAARRGHMRDDARPVVPEEPCPADPRGAAETQEEQPGDPKRNAGPLTPLGTGVWGPLCPCWGHAGSRPPHPPTAGRRLVHGDPFPHVYWA